MDKIKTFKQVLVDDKGRERIFHGVNFVNKCDYVAGEQRVPDLDEEMVKKIAANGVNLIRFGFTWANIEPNPGEYNDAYIDAMGEVLDLLEKYNIYAFLDMHQDLYSSVTNSDGAPAWAVLLDGVEVKPTKFVWAEGYFWGKACHTAFDNFWANRKVKGKGLQDYYADCWAHVIEKIGDKPAVIGYDIMNEPFPGSPGGKVFKRIVAGAIKTILFDKEVKRLDLIKALFDKEDPIGRVLTHIDYAPFHRVTKSSEEIIREFDTKVYGPFIAKVSTRMRQVSDKLILMNNCYYSNLGIPFCAPPVTVDGKRDENQVFAPHAYDLMVDTPAYKFAHNGRVAGIFDEHRNSQNRLDVPVIVGEWGSFGDDTDDWLPHINHLFGVFEKYKWSHTYWCYIEGFFENRLMKVFRRPFPKAVSGTIDSYHYDIDTKIFTLDFTQDENACGETIIGTPFEVESVTVDGAEYPVDCRNYELFINTTAGKHSIKVKVK